MHSPLPPPIAGTRISRPDAPAPISDLPFRAAAGAVAVLVVSLIASKYVLDLLVGFAWPVIFYVALLAVLGYGPSLWWCRLASRRWGSGHLGADIGLSPRFADLGWGPVIWLGALGAQVVVAAFIVALDIPLAGNTDGIEQIRADRTYVISLVITAVIAAPIAEEMAFRGVVLRGLRSRLPMAVAVVLQGVLFGVAHIDPVRGVGNIGLVMVLSGVGVVFGIAAATLRRIGPSIVAHAMFNAAVLTLVLTGTTSRLHNESSEMQRGVVDQPHVADGSGDRDAHL